MAKKKGLSIQAEIVFAFFIGGAISSIAQDPSDVLFFYAEGQGWLANAAGQTFFWYIVPFLVYGSFAAGAYLIGKYTAVRPTIVLWIYLFSVGVSTLFALTLPQTSSDIYIGTVFLATVVSVFTVRGVWSDAHKYHNRH